MTFQTAFNSLQGPEFQTMRSDDYCPIHVMPLYVGGIFHGYQSNSLLHQDCWASDILARVDHSGVEFSGERLLLRPGANRKVFNRDCCFLLENIFFADGNGIEIDSDMIRILKQVQPDKQVDNYALFGYRADGSVDGLTGSHRRIDGAEAEEFISIILKRVTKHGNLRARGQPSHGKHGKRKNVHTCLGRASTKPGCK